MEGLDRADSVRSLLELIDLSTEVATWEFSFHMHDYKDDLVALDHNCYVDGSGNLLVIPDIELPWRLQRGKMSPWESILATPELEPALMAALKLEPPAEYCRYEDFTALHAALVAAGGDGRLLVQDITSGEHVEVTVEADPNADTDLGPGRHKGFLHILLPSEMQQRVERFIREW